MSDDEHAWADRVRGCLLGGALGDALGAPFEGVPRVGMADVDRHIEGATELTWTDDTALQLATAAYLATLQTWSEFDDDRHARVLAEAWEQAPDRGYGSNPPYIFRTVLGGGDWRAAAAESFGGAGSLGNGGAMRAAPVGAVSAPVEQVAGLARRTAMVTHAHPEGQDGAVVVAVTARLALGAGAGSAPTVDDVLAACLPHLRTDAVRRALDVLPEAVEVADPARAAAVTGNGVPAREAAAAALCAFLRFPCEPLEAVRFAVLMGGDADTVAAIAGSLSGAVAGSGALPEPLLDRLESRAEIERVAAALATRSRTAATS